MAQSERLSGTVTFLFTDIEGSTGLLKQLGREKYGQLLARQQELLREAFAAHNGEEIDTQGDSFFVAFRSAADAVAAAVAIQLALADHEWPEGVAPRVRVGIHTGEAAAAGERYVGFSVHRAARIGDVAHGGQVLLSSTTRDLAEDDLPGGVFLRDLGLWRLKDVDRPERISQACAEGLRSEFPPLRGAEPIKSPPVLRRRSLLLAMLAGVIAAAVAVPVFALGSGSGGPPALASIQPNSVGELDVVTGRISASIPVGTGPGPAASGFGSIWTANVGDDSVSRIDPKTNAVMQTIKVGNGPAGIAVGGRFVWVTDSLDGKLSQIDPGTNSEVNRVPVGNGPIGVAYGSGAVWVANAADSTVVRIDPSTDTVSVPISVETGADGVAVGDGGVWVTSGQLAGSVSRIDPGSRTVTQTIGVGNGPTGIAIGGGSVWVANQLDGTVSRIDPRTNSEQAKIPVGDGPTGIVVVPAGAVWVSDSSGGTLTEIEKGGVTRTVGTENRPEGIALNGRSMYVAVRASGIAHRGGTLRMVAGSNSVPESWWIDPAEYPFTASLTNDGLTGFERVGGGEGTRLVPDLAASLPTPTASGTIYTFQLRPGIRYSDGEPVRPEDFRRAVERSLVLADSGARQTITGIVGAARCVEKPKRCDLSEGIATDDAARTITFHLTAPDPDFLYKLALPYVFAVPARTPLLNAHLPLPATGPYMVASFSPRAGIRFVRNPYFREWSQSAQPSGYPDVIVLRFGYSAAAQIRAVERGQADYAVDGIPSDLVKQVTTLFAGQTHISPTLATQYLPLNTRKPPFASLKARQAFSYAIDRRQLRARGRSTVSCQVLPPGFPGYRRYCPYTIDPSDAGRYVGPDLTKARELVLASGTKGQAVTVWTYEDPLARRQAVYLESVLRSIGYRARLRVVKDLATLYTNLSESRPQVSTVVGWFADYAAPSDFFRPLLTCASFNPVRGNGNYTGFCNESIDREIAKATSLDATNPPAAQAIWSRVDRDVVDQAPWIVVANPQSVDFVSRRVGNYTYSPQYSALLDQMWVR